MRRWLLRRGRVRLALETLVLVQLGHLGEHLVQIAQIHLLGWPAPQARGFIAAFDVETVHFLWNLGVLASVAGVLRSCACSKALFVRCAGAAAHTRGPAYLVTRCLLTGVESAPGILGRGGLLASTGMFVPGLTTWTRPTVHLAWNTGEIALLVVAYVTFAWPSLPARSRRALTVAPGA